MATHVLIELNGKQYLYDSKREVLYPFNHSGDFISFSTIRKDKELQKSLGYTDDMHGIRKKASHLVIQAHVAHDLHPGKIDLRLMRLVFPCVSLPEIEVKLK